MSATALYGEGRNRYFFLGKSGPGVRNDLTFDVETFALGDSGIMHNKKKGPA